MKTGRVRKKKPASTPQKQKPASKPKPKTTAARGTSRAATGATAAAAPRRRALTGPQFFGVFFGIAAFAVLAMVLITTLFANKADEWVVVNRASGQWTATVKIMGPQVTREQQWEADCRTTPEATVRPGTCILKDTEQHDDRVVDDYEEYAYNIYYEETYGQIYQAQGAAFVVTQLGTDDWWEQDLHYVLEEELDTGSCEYTQYTTWVDDPDDAELEMEVYLSECEVWDHVVVYERVYEQARWCACDVVRVVELGQESEQGSGPSIRWPEPSVPAGGRTERAFEATVTFQGDGHTYTTTTTDLATYLDYVTAQYYIGLDGGKPIRVSKDPKQ